jgi:hypothetical protein
LLLLANSNDATFNLVILGVALFVLVPISCLCIKCKAKQIEFFHPGQERLGRIVCAEAIVYATCFATFGYSQWREFESYTLQMMAFYIFFAGIHLIMLMLQNTLSIVETRNEPNSHQGIGAVRKCPVYAFSIIFCILALLQIITAFLAIAQVSYWNFWFTFQLFHNIETVRVIDYILYGMAALVQIIKIFNFLSHCGQKHAKSASHKCMSMIGLIVSIASLALITANMWLLAYYQRVGDKFLDTYNLLCIIVMIPLLHIMILRQESTKQRGDFLKNGNGNRSINDGLVNTIY